ncbi:hypothetical protein D3C78_1201340 [compost metagenome]
MTSKTHAPKTATAGPATTPDAATEQPSKTTGIPEFRFPFTPATYSPKSGDEQPWYQHNNKCNHDQRPGMAPRNTRRSMGKR